MCNERFCRDFYQRAGTGFAAERVIRYECDRGRPALLVWRRDLRFFQFADEHSLEENLRPTMSRIVRSTPDTGGLGSPRTSHFD